MTFWYIIKYWICRYWGNFYFKLITIPLLAFSVGYSKSLNWRLRNTLLPLCWMLTIDIFGKWYSYYRKKRFRMIPEGEKITFNYFFQLVITMLCLIAGFFILSLEQKVGVVVILIINIYVYVDIWEHKNKQHRKKVESENIKLKKET